MHFSTEFPRPGRPPPSLLGFLADFSRNELITGVDGDKRDSTDNVVIEDEKWITWAAGPFNASARVACIGARVCVATG